MGTPTPQQCLEPVWGSARSPHHAETFQATLKVAHECKATTTKTTRRYFFLGGGRQKPCVLSRKHPKNITHSIPEPFKEHLKKNNIYIYIRFREENTGGLSRG